MENAILNIWYCAKIKIYGDKNMLKTIVIGSPGAGKSTFARKLRDVTGLPLYYLDMLWHKPDQTTISREMFDAQLNEILKKDRWIIDGNYQRTLEMRLKACDTVFLLDFPQKQLPQIYQLLKKYQNEKQIIILKSREEAERYLQS